MAIKPRRNNRVNHPRGNDGIHGPSSETSMESTTPIQHLCKKEHKISQSPVSLYSEDQIDVEELRLVVTRMKQKGSCVYHVNCKERIDIANDELKSLWRQMLVNWMFYVADCCGLQQHSVAVASYFLDVAMLRDLCQTREEHQLAAATSLQMALKTFDVAVIKLDKLVKLGRGLFTEDDVVTMEMKIINSLNWNLHPPTVYCFLRQYGRLIPPSVNGITRKVLDNVTSIIAEEMIVDERYVKHCPSILSLASTLVALDFVPDGGLSKRLRRTFESRLFFATRTKKDSTVLSKVIKKIYKSLKRRDKLQDIVDMTSTKSKGARMYRTALQNMEKNNNKNNVSEQHSPRDVKAKIRQHSPRDVRTKLSA